MRKISDYAMVTNKLPLGDAITEAESLIKKHFLIAADMPLLNRAYDDPAIKEYLQNESIDVYSHLGFQLLMRRPVLEVCHFPQSSLPKQSIEMRKYQEVLKNPTDLGSQYKIRVRPESIPLDHDFLRKLLVGGHDSDFTIDDGLLEKKFTPFADINELCLENAVIRAGDGERRFLLLNQRFLK